MKTITINPETDKASLLRLAFNKARETGSYRFNLKDKEFNLSFCKQRDNSKYFDLHIQDNQGLRVELSLLSRGDVIQNYFREEIKAEKDRLGVKDEMIFIQVDG